MSKYPLGCLGTANEGLETETVRNQVQFNSIQFNSASKQWIQHFVHNILYVELRNNNIIFGILGNVTYFLGKGWMSGLMPQNIKLAELLSLA